MKKVMAIGLMMVMLLSMGLTVFAEPGGFVNSPSENPAPELVEFTPGSDDCTAEIVITAYSERHTMGGVIQEMLEEAYTHIYDADEITSLNDDLAELAVKLDVAASDLAVSDLFDISYIGCDDHTDHGYFDFVIKAETLKGFVGLLHYHNDDWRLVENAEVYTKNGEWHLKFSVDEFSPFAIVVNTNPNAPKTGDNSMIYTYVIIMAVSALAILVIAVKMKKQSAK